ncbi:transposase [Vibrio alginolyticus]|nr:transposase [Vibrio alginolyticus]EJL6749796.1 transposase [Vibrio alginolyticus]EMA9138545.1 transposase [Vibrio alginolyticus]
MGRAVGYVLNQWSYLKRYVGHGLYPIDNNRLERSVQWPLVEKRGCSATHKVAPTPVLYCSVSCRLAEQIMLNLVLIYGTY